MLSKAFTTSLLFLFMMSLVPPARAAFKGPLETPAFRHPEAVKNRLTAVARSGDRLVAVGPRGVILLSEDGGKKWQQPAVPVSSNLVAVHFPTPNQGWAVGHEGVILHTDDGGRTWTKQLDGNLLAKEIVAHYEKRSAAGADAPKVSEEVQRFAQEGADKPFLDVWFANDKEGFAVGAYNLGVHTTDGGRSWEPLLDVTDNPKGLHLYSVRGEGTEIYIAGETGLLRRWDRKANRFVPLASPYNGTFFGLLARDSTLVVFGLRGNAFRSNDRGKSWRRLETRTTAGLTGGAFLEDGRAVLVSQDGQALVVDPRSETCTPAKLKHPMSFSGVAAGSDNGIVTVGSRGVVTESLRK